MVGVAVLGSTGSVGTSSLDVIEAHRDRFELVAISGNRNLDLLRKQIETFAPAYCHLADPETLQDLRASLRNTSTEVVCGDEGLARIISDERVECVVAAISGAAGLPASVATLEAGKRLALANKESLVMAGALLRRLVDSRGGVILPVDSEHSAVFQALQCGHPGEVHRIILTASGGPFRTVAKEELIDKTPADALRHPTWDMGAKITIDSATMMNKALEIVEARWLFGVPRETIDVVVHPQSLVHSMVEYVDGNVIAQMSEPDMRLPIQYALSYPDRIQRPESRFDVRKYASMTFEEPDYEKFPALGLGFAAAERGGTSGAVLNAANEVAVDRFLAGDISFPAISQIVADVMADHEIVEADTLGVVLEADRWARREAHRRCDAAVAASGSKVSRTAGSESTGN